MLLLLINKKINSREIVTFIKRRWKIAIIVSLVFYFVMLFTVKLIKNINLNEDSKYSVSAKMLVTTPSPKSKIVINQTNATQLGNAYSDVLKSDLILKSVQASANKKISLKKIRKATKITFNDVSSIITIEVYGESKQLVTHILNPYLKVSEKKISSVMGAGKIVVLDHNKPVVAKSSERSFSNKGVVLLVLISLFAGVCAAIFMEAHDRTIRDSSFAESTLGARPTVVHINTLAHDVSLLSADIQVKFKNLDLICFHVLHSSDVSTKFLEQLIKATPNDPIAITTDDLVALAQGKSSNPNQIKSFLNKSNYSFASENHSMSHVTGIPDATSISSVLSELSKDNKSFVVSKDEKASGIRTIVSNIVQLNCVVIVENMSDKQNVFRLIEDLKRFDKKYMIVYLSDSVTFK